MFNLFSKRFQSLLVGLLAINSSLSAWDYCNPCGLCEEPSCNRLYIGAFGGGLYADSSRTYQLGTAFFTEASGGPLAVEAEGHLKHKGTGFGGVQIGYEWARDLNCSCWALAPAIEAEAFWYSTHRRGHLFNQTDTDRLPEHDFVNSFRISSGVYLANLVFSLKNDWWCGKLTPYVGAGVGATRLSLHGAKSIQVRPVERGINHFNSRTDDSSWAFAAQIKTGLRYDICERFHLFGEYRYLYVDSSNYIFGSTVYPEHAHTTPWNVKIKSIHYNAFALGVQYDL